MVSWSDGEESSTDVSSDASSGLNTLYDSDFTGLDDGEVPTCCKHGEICGKYVAFEGCYTCRRFLGCAMQEGVKCDTVKWVDPNWPETLQSAIGKLWQMYRDVKSRRVTEALEFMDKKFEFADEKKKLHMIIRQAQDELKNVVEEKELTLALKEKAEQALLDAWSELHAKKITDECHSNMQKVLRIKAEKERDELKNERDELKKEVDDLKKDNKKLEYIVADFLRLKEESKGKERDELKMESDELKKEVDDLKKDKKKLEYIVADFLKQKEETRGKMRKIRALCDE